MNKQRGKRAAALALAGWVTLLGGCGTTGAWLAREQMERRNEADLKSGKSTPREYRERRDEIDRNLK